MARKNLLASRMHKSVMQDDTIPASRNTIIEAKEPKTPLHRRKEGTISSPETDAKAEKETVAVKPQVQIAIKVVIVALCVYICFLIYGLLSTNYKYDNTGEIYPEVLSVSDIHDLNQYEALVEFYLRSRALYESILTIDNALAKDAGQALNVAMDYTELLDPADKLLIDLSAAEYDMRYSSLYESIGVWTNNACQYLQYISSAITHNNSTDAEAALQLRDMLYMDFANITANIAQLAENTKGAKNNEIYQWSPETFIAGLGED